MCRPKLFHYILAIALLSSFSVVAQETQTQTDSEAAVSGIRESVQAARRVIVSDEMFFTEDEATEFWPIYDEYRREINVVGDRYAKLITDFAALYNEGRITGGDADMFTDTRLEIEVSILAIERKYLPKFRAVLSSLKATRFYQLENQMNAESEAQIAMAIPLVDLE
jgi:hypothetical protein